MRRSIVRTSLIAALAVVISVGSSVAQSINADYDYDHAKIDRYLSAEVWSDHYDGEYYEGDNIVVNFRVNTDAFVAIYSIDTRGRVNLLFPAEPNEENYVRGGVTYSLPGEDSDFDLEVSGPEGFEHIQIIASREQFPVPDWYHNSGLVCDWEDRAEYMDFLNSSEFVRYEGQRFAYDRAVIYVNEWEEVYYRPVYYPSYPSWTIYGNAYIDYPWGATVYVNGIYWGVTPLYIPRICVGWHTFTIYDHWGHCWESDTHISRYNTVVFDKTIVQVSPGVKSKYKEVHTVGYRDPVSNGYPKYKAGTVLTDVHPESGKVTRGKGEITSKDMTAVGSLSKKYVKGSATVVKTSRGYETDASTAVFSGKESRKQGSTTRTKGSLDSRQESGSAGKTSGTTSGVGSGSKVSRKGSTSVTTDKSGQSGSSSGSGYYQKKTGGSKSTSSTTARGSDKATTDKGSTTRIEPKSSDKASPGTHRKQSTVTPPSTKQAQPKEQPATKQPEVKEQPSTKQPKASHESSTKVESKQSAPKSPETKSSPSEKASSPKSKHR